MQIGLLAETNTANSAKAIKSTHIALIAFFLLAFAFLAEPTFADVPVVNSIVARTRTSDNHTIVNITVTHRNYYTGHYVDWVQVDVNGTVNTVNLSEPQPVSSPFAVEYDLGVAESSLKVQARAHCNLHGESVWSSIVDLGEDSQPRGLFNPNATFSADLTMLFQIAIFFSLFAGFGMTKSKRFVKHGVIIGSAVALHTISILAIMVPSLLRSGGLFENLSRSLSLVVLSHVALGILVETLGIYIVAAWVLDYRNVKPCFKRKRYMRVAAVCWLIDLILGAYVYVLLYVPI